tara:strand:- start:2385 stop:2762 length:378 start_codon:yes stop_codon:yes gene_type:complete
MAAITKNLSVQTDKESVRIYECSIARMLRHRLVKSKEEQEDMRNRGVITTPDEECTFLSIKSMVYCIKEIDQFLNNEKNIPFDKLLIDTKTYDCNWIFRDIQKLYCLKLHLRNAIASYWKQKEQI